MSTEKMKRGGSLSIRTDGERAELKIEGTDEDIIFNLSALTMTAADDLHMPVEFLLLVVAEQAKRIKRDIQKDIRIDESAVERMVGRGGDQKN